MYTSMCLLNTGAFHIPPNIYIYLYAPPSALPALRIYIISLLSHTLTYVYAHWGRLVCTASALAFSTLSLWWCTHTRTHTHCQSVVSSQSYCVQYDASCWSYLLHKKLVSIKYFCFLSLSIHIYTFPVIISSSCFFYILNCFQKRDGLLTIFFQLKNVFFSHVSDIWKHNKINIYK